MQRLVLVLLFLPLLALAASVPTGLRVVDVRGITGQPELDTWLGSLQGTLNRQPAQTPVFVVRTDVDAAWADVLMRTYRLTRETLAPGALLAAAKPGLTGQVLYDAKQPWTRVLAVAEAARAKGAAIATDTDLGLPTVADLRGRWADHAAAMAAALDAAADPAGAVLAPESGHWLADLIAARQWPALSALPGVADDDAKLVALLGRLKADAPLLGSPDLTTDDKGKAFWNLTGRLLPGGQALWHARYAGNLSAWARFPATRPLVQGREEVVQKDPGPMLVLVYDGGDAVSDGAQSLDFATNTLLPLLSDPALTELPVGVEVPMGLHALAPALYQALLAKGRFCAAELVGAPNGAGWTLPMLLKDPAPFAARTAAAAGAMDLAGLVLYDIGDTTAYDATLAALAARGLRGALLRPVDAAGLPDKQARTNRALTDFVALVGSTRVRTGDELRTFARERAAQLAQGNPLARDPDSLFTVVFVDPYGVPPGVIATLLPELRQTFTLATPSQAFRAYGETKRLLPWMRAQDTGKPNFVPRRDAPRLRVSTPTTTEARPAADIPLPVRVTITGDAPVIAARLIYQGPDGRIGAADLHRDGATWRAVLPPLLIGGTVTITARAVDGTGFGEAYSAPLTLTLPVVDADKDGADDTLETYLGSDPAQWDTDADGLPDGLDSAALTPNRDVTALGAPVMPPADLAYLTAAGTSTVDATSRTLPAGTAVTYRLPLADLPAGSATLRLVSFGAGTVTVNGTPTPLDAAPTAPMLTDVPVQIAGAALTVTVTAGAGPLRLFSLGLATNAAGPYVLPAQVSPPAPFSGAPVRIRVVAYSPEGIKAVRVQYGANVRKMTTLVLTPAAQAGNVVYEGTLPGTSSPFLVYNVLAEDTKGRVTRSPFTAVAVGRTPKHSLALLATRDMRGTWQPAPIWGLYGRALPSGGGEDRAVPNAVLRPGTYTAWLLAAPRARGIDVRVFYHDILSPRDSKTYLQAAVPAGRPDGWFKLGTFTLEEITRLVVSVVPHGDTGFCAYGEVVLTQDEAFTPPLTHGTVDWFNSLKIAGITDDQRVTAPVTVRVLAAGNVDAVEVTAVQVHGTREVVLEANDDGTYRLDPRKLGPGTWQITAKGLRVYKKDGRRIAEPLLSVSVRVRTE